jgi:hypothetical protein
MDEVVEALVLSPFREIVAKGRAASESARVAAADSSASEAKELGRAARSLEREGQRAVQKIEPLCIKQLESCGQIFIDALKDDGMFCVMRPNGRDGGEDNGLTNSPLIFCQMTLLSIALSSTTSSGSLTTM